MNEVIDAVANSPWYRLIGMKPKILNDKIVVELEIDEKKHYQALGLTHGGVIASILDSCIGLRINFELLKMGKKAVTAQLNIHYLKPVRGGRLVGEGEIVRIGSKTAVGIGKVTCGDEEVATGTATFIVLDR